MMGSFYAGGDWSGQVDRADDVFIFCVVALPDVEAWNDSCRDLRQQLGMAQNKEFHAHSMKNDAQRLQVLIAGRELGMRVGALILSNRAEELNGAPSYESIALELLGLFFPVCLLKTLWFDQEIQGRTREQKFQADVRRCFKAIHPDASLKVTPRASHASNLIQLADVMAYAWRTQTRGTLQDAALNCFLKETEAGAENVIVRR